jgi:hypothetical protein
MEYTFEMRVQDNMNAIVDRYGAFGAWVHARKNAQADNEDISRLYTTIAYRIAVHLEETQNTEFMSYIAMARAMARAVEQDS